MGNYASRARLAAAEVKDHIVTYNALYARIQASPGVPRYPSTLPFWSVPSSPIASHPSDCLPDYADVVIIGSGITAAAFARTLLDYPCERPLNVVLLEARDTCSGATGRNGGHINPPLYHDYLELKRKFGKSEAQRIIRFRQAHLKELIHVAIEEDLLKESQAREVETVDVYYEGGLFDEAKSSLKAWKQDMPYEASSCWVCEREEAIERFGLSEKVVGCIVDIAGAIHPYRFVSGILLNLLQRHPQNFTLSTGTSVTAIHAPTKSTPLYILNTQRGTLTTPHVIHATNAWVSHLLPQLRGKIVPIRGNMSAQRPGRALNKSTRDGERSFIFYEGRGYDYLTQLPKGTGCEDEEGGELMFGGGFAQANKNGMNEVANMDDNSYNSGISAYLTGALPLYFGLLNWGAEAHPASFPAAGPPPLSTGESEPARIPASISSSPVPTTASCATMTLTSDDVRWPLGRTKALWTGILGISVDGLPWVGRLPPKVAGRAQPPRSSTPVATLVSSPIALLTSESHFSSPSPSAFFSTSDSKSNNASNLTASPAEWIAAGYSGEGMVHAWLSGKALALLVLGGTAQREMEREGWFPQAAFGVNEKRWKRAKVEDMFDRFRE